MRLKLIACKVLQREIGALAAANPNFIDITYLRQGYHNEPGTLREIVQREIDLIDSGDDPHTCHEQSGAFDAILLGYGLCCNGVMGLRSARHTLVIPKAHDCITMFLGTRERYKDYFDKYSGTYWFTAGWVENTLTEARRREYLIKLYTELYGEENAEYLADVETNWQGKYNRVTYVDWPGHDLPDLTAYPRELAAEWGLEYDRLEGDDSMLRDFLRGKWDDRFLVVPPGHTIEPSYGEDVLISKPIP